MQKSFKFYGERPLAAVFNIGSQSSSIFKVSSNFPLWCLFFVNCSEFYKSPATFQITEPPTPSFSLGYYKNGLLLIKNLKISSRFYLW